MQTPVSTTQQVLPPFQGKFALFLNTKNPQSKSNYSGKLSFNVALIPDLVAYLQSHQPDERGNVNLFLVGFDNQSRTGVAYIGGYASAEQARGPAVQYGQQQAAPPMAQQAPPPFQQGGYVQASPAVQQQYQQPAPPVQAAPPAYPPGQVQQAPPQGQVPANAWVVEGVPSKPPF